MPFNSLYFLLFLFIVAVVFFAVKKGDLQKLVLIVASFVFAFFFNPLSAIVLGVSCFLNYFLLKNLSLVEKGRKKTFYSLGIILNVSLLLVYKVLQDVLSNANLSVFEGFDNSKWIILGIGFYTLQIIGYYIDVYKRSIAFGLTLPDFLLSTIFFSKLPSGPILNLKSNAKNFPAHAVKFTEANFSYASQRILLGLFKKVALADRLVPYVSNVFDHHYYINGLMIYLGPILFTIQLYLDFSAYIDIAIGSARLFGINLPENFNRPLRATSIVDFWRRWHITLVNWLTNYIFYPVSYRYRKLGKSGLAIAVVCTFVVSALWHGIAVTFLIWAACHFIYIIIENIFFKKKSNSLGKSWVGKMGAILLVWHLVAFSNLFFRSPSIQDAGRLFNDIKSLPLLYADGLSFKSWLINGGGDIESEFNFRLSVFLCLLFLMLEKKANKYAQSEKYNIIYVSIMLVLIAVFGMFNAGERFIYLQF